MSCEISRNGTTSCYIRNEAKNTRTTRHASHARVGLCAIAFGQSGVGAVHRTWPGSGSKATRQLTDIAMYQLDTFRPLPRLFILAASCCERRLLGIATARKRKTPGRQVAPAHVRIDSGPGGVQNQNDQMVKGVRSRGIASTAYL